MSTPSQSSALKLRTEPQVRTKQALLCVRDTAEAGSLVVPLRELVTLQLRSLPGLQGGAVS